MVTMSAKELRSDEYCDTVPKHSGLGSRYAYLSMNDFVITHTHQKLIKTFIENCISK